MRSKKTPQNSLSIALEHHQEEHQQAAGYRQPFHVSPGPFLPVPLASPVVLLEYVELTHPRKRRKQRRDGTLITERATTIWWYKLLVSSTQKAAPAFIKLGQWAASRTDLFPGALCQHFGKLHSKGKPHLMTYTRQVLEKSFDKKFNNLFVSFNPEPLGIGAFAQQPSSPICYQFPTWNGGYKVGKLIVERCQTPELLDEVETFAVKTQHPVLAVKSQTFSLSKTRVAGGLVSFLTAVREHHVKMEADFINTVLSILILNFIGRQLNPNLDLFQSALPPQRPQQQEDECPLLQSRPIR
ncbi:hypothetical protein PCASD_17108 [Puccinia coronata f. sp. avenae]|uniref:Uncharacterized protein n=1 Tax=Puccinia coronata f. sp. avenae TaxID=200324 RepID=A0A2N5T586_9BASI|nr:hypothetical protein PCASD_17108 [Puccinia coronata f. sp. avenae]